MFRSKSDVDKHVSDILSKLQSENEKNLRGYNFARFYYQVKDYESAKKYLSSYLSVRDQHAPSHKFMGQMFEETGNLEKALKCYKRSLEVDPHQKEIVLKICDLYHKLPVDHETAKYWADRAEGLFPHHEVVFRLRECMVNGSGEPDRQELENLIKKELVSQPLNLNLQIKLLQLYLDSKRVKDAFKHASNLENKLPFPYSTEWYSMVVEIYEAYQNLPNQELDPSFYIMFLSALDHLVYLMLAEPYAIPEATSSTITTKVDEAAIVLLQFDQHLKKASNKELTHGPWLYFLHHMKGQLYYHLGTLLLKQTKKDQRNWKETYRTAAALFLVGYSFKPSNLLQEIWFSQMNDQQKLFANFFQKGSLRTNFLGHIIIALCKEDKGKWLQKIRNEVCLPQVQEQTFNRLFSSANQKLNNAESYFLNDNTFVNCSLEFPEILSLLEYNKAAYKLCISSLHYLVWLHLHKESSENGYINNLYESFKGLQFGHNNLSRGSPESLCILDLEAFLLATVYTTNLLLEQKGATMNDVNRGTALAFPPDITDRLCSNEQNNWWQAAHGLVNNTVKEKLGEQRRILQRGLEVIRGIGNHGLEVQLLVHLARNFGDRAAAMANQNSNESGSKKTNQNIFNDKVSALEIRAVHYWGIVLTFLEKLDSNQNLRVPKDRMFVGVNKPLSKSEISSLREEGKLYLACRLMNSGKLDKAIDTLDKLSSPYASYYSSLAYKKLALQESAMTPPRTALLNKARDSLYATMDRIRSDNGHELNNEIYLEIEDIENEIGKNINYANSSNNNESEINDDYDTADSSFAFSHNGTPVSKSKHIGGHSTPRPSSMFMTARNKYQTQSTPNKTHFEPSPERLDAQIRSLAMTQSTLINTLLEQQRSILDSNKAIVEQIKVNTDVLLKLEKKLDNLHITNGRQHRPMPRRSQSHIEEASATNDDFEPNDYFDYYADENNEDFRHMGYNYGQSARTDSTNSSVSYVPPGTLPPTHYAYQYPPPSAHPHHPLASLPEQSHYYPPAGTPISGLPLNEGQPLPQFRFHVATPIIKPSVMNVPPPIPTSFQQPPIPTVLPTPSSQPPIPWTEASMVPHAFQISLPVTSVVVPASTTLVQTTFSTPAISTSEVPRTVSTEKSSSESPILLKALLHGSTTNPVLGVSSTAETPSNSLSNFSFKTPPSNLSETSLIGLKKETDSSLFDTDAEEEVMGDFKPVIPLPAEVTVRTGEEDEVALFEDHGRLYRFVDKEWKERGTGSVKILKNKLNGDIRLLMRRDQVHKICANHKIVSKMEMHRFKNSDKALTWIAHDFSEGSVKLEHFCIRFKKLETANAFLKAFEDAVLYAKSVEKAKSASSEIKPVINSLVSNATELSSSFDTKFVPKTSSNTCATCYGTTTNSKIKCDTCELQNSSNPLKNLENLVTYLPLSVTPVKNTAEGEGIFSFEKSNLNNLSTNSVNDGNQNQISTTITKSPLANFSFTTPENKVSKPEVKSTESKPVFSDFAAALSGKSKLGNSELPKVGGFTFSSIPVIKETPQELQDREILLVSTKSKDGPQVTKLDSIKTSPFSGFSFNFSKASSAKDSESKNDSVFKSFNDSSVFSTPQQEKSSQEFVSASESPFLVTVTNEGRRVSKEFPESPEDDFVPTAEFKPVIPLPALVDIKTGEEGEEKLFGERAKLFRYDADNKEWKERGVGEIKILHSIIDDKYRILMRRDQVLKICANHYILPEMKLIHYQANGKSWLWCAQDFSDGELRDEQFAIRFKSIELANKFQKVFEDCRSLVETKKSNVQVFKDASQTSTNPCVGNSQSFGEMFKPKPNSWECDTCYVRNEGTNNCLACNSLKPGLVSSAETLPKTEESYWECLVCQLKNAPMKIICSVCDTPKGSKEKPLKTSSGFGDLFKIDPSTWECSGCYVRNSANQNQCIACNSNKPGSSGNVGTVDTFKFGIPPSETTPSSKNSGSSGFVFGGKSNTSPFPGFKFDVPASNENKVDSKTTSEFIFGSKSDASSSSNYTFGASSLFSGFKPSFGSTETIENKSIFGSAVTTPSSNSNPLANFSSFFAQQPDVTINPVPSTATVQSTPSIASTISNSSSVSPAVEIPKSSVSFKFGATTPESKCFEFHFGSPQKYEFSFSGVQPRSPPKSLKSPGTPTDAGEEDEVEQSDADNIYFSPVIPLPPKIDIKTGEEDENVLFNSRAKLFRFVEGEWKERGIGNLKILHHPSQNTVRLLMRRDQVLKICLNHFLTRDITFTKKEEKSILWTTIDYSENEGTSEKFAVRFKNAELANQFYDAIENAKVLLKSCDSAEKTVDSVKKNLNFSNSEFKDIAEIGSEKFAKALSSFSFTLDNEKPKSFDLASRLGVSPTKASNEEKEPELESKSRFNESPTKAPVEPKVPDLDVVIVHEFVATPDQIAKAKYLMLPTNFYLYENKPSCPGCRGCQDDVPVQQNIKMEENKPTDKDQKVDTSNTETESLMFPSSSVSFASIASQNTEFNLNKSTDSNVFQGAGQKLFENRSMNEDDEGTVENPDIHFEPIIPLPDLVDVKTGEEDETPIFSHRAKLYRFDSALGQWKERGIGEMKILKHKEQCRFRLLLRREQVHKVACNHLISEDIELTPLKTSETSLCWFAIDYSESQPDRSQFAIKFKNKEIMQEFKTKFDESKASIIEFKQRKLNVENTSTNENSSTLLPESHEPNIIKEEKSAIKASVSSNANSAGAGDILNTSNVTNDEYHGSEEDDDDDDDLEDEEQDDDEEDDDDEIIFDKRVSFELYNESKKIFETIGMGSLRVLYDDTVFGYRINFINDKDVLSSDHIIAIQTCLRTQDKCAMWAAIDISINPPKKRQFRATFSSIQAAEDFASVFEEGKQAAVQAEIVEKSEKFY